MALWLIAALVVRAWAGPVLAVPPAAGLVPLCLGGEIVYVALEGQDRAVEFIAPEDDERLREPCPAFGFSGDAFGAPPVALAPLAGAQPTPAPVTARTKAYRPAPAFEARAPPRGGSASFIR
ncbi:MAG: hypothetical protein AAGI34_14015 [Pseudomonadota bacterium]